MPLTNNYFHGADEEICLSEETIFFFKEVLIIDDAYLIQKLIFVNFCLWSRNGNHWPDRDELGGFKKINLLNRSVQVFIDNILNNYYMMYNYYTKLVIARLGVQYFSSFSYFTGLFHEPLG